MSQVTLNILCMPTGLSSNYKFHFLQSPVTKHIYDGLLLFHTEQDGQTILLKNGTRLDVNNVFAWRQSILNAFRHCSSPAKSGANDWYVGKDNIESRPCPDETA